MSGTYHKLSSNTCSMHEKSARNNKQKKKCESLRPHLFPRLRSAKVWKEGKSPRTFTRWAGSQRNPEVLISEKCHLSSAQEKEFFSSKTTAGPSWGCPLQSVMGGSESLTYPVPSNGPDDLGHSHRGVEASQYQVREREEEACFWPSFALFLESRCFSPFYFWG